MSEHSSRHRTSILASFPWDYIESRKPSDPDVLVRWIYTHFAGRAYQSFMELGRGLLVGPFLTDQGKNLISDDEALQRHYRGIPMDLTVTYLPVADPALEQTVPDRSLRLALLAAAGRYVPDRECVVLTLADNMPHLARVVGATGGAAHLASPKMTYELRRQDRPGSLVQ